MTASARPSSHATPRLSAAARTAAAFWTLIGIGLALEIVLLLGWLRPLSLWRTPHNLFAGAPMVPILGQNPAGALRFAVPALLLCALWVAALAIASRLRTSRAAIVALAFSLLFLVTLLPINPGGTQDIYHNVADGRLFWKYGVNPTLVPPQAYADDPFITHAWGYADLPSAYGPLWYELIGPPVILAGDGLVANLVAQKALSAAFMFGTVLLVALAAHSIVPGRLSLAVVLTGWCPLLLFESAGNGHNDSIMTFFLAAAFLAAVRRAYIWVLPLLALSILVKYTTALLVPVVIVWLLRRPDVSRRQILAGAALATVLSVAAYLPMWAGRDTIAAIERPGMTFILSPATLAHGALAAWLSDADASRLVRAVTGLAFATIYGISLWRTRGDARDLAARSFDVLFAYLVLASWWFWPWYITWLVPAATLARGWTRIAVFATFAIAALFTYLYWWPDPPWRSQRWFLAYAAIVLAVFVVPVAVWFAGVIRRPRRVLGASP